MIPLKPEEALSDAQRRAANGSGCTRTTWSATSSRRSNGKF
jgi:hypothetical protein